VSRNSDVTIDYTNWRGERRVRTVTPLRFYFGLSNFHSKEGAQWIMVAYDPEKGSEREFAMQHIHAWKSA
jgi:predicted DNA-binding transcriptional regulator YafY